MSTRRKQYRVYGNGVLLSEPGISARDMKSLVALIRANGRKARVDEYSGRHDIWITVQDDGGYMDALTAHTKDRNKSGGRVTYTVATIDPYTQRSTSRLGRQVSKREAMKVADLWESHGTQNVCVIDSRGIIHRQPSNHAVNRNRSGGYQHRPQPCECGSLGAKWHGDDGVRVYACDACWSVAHENPNRRAFGLRGMNTKQARTGRMKAAKR